jgi:hypothetical protein
MAATMATTVPIIILFFFLNSRDKIRSNRKMVQKIEPTEHYEKRGK